MSSHFFSRRRSCLSSQVTQIMTCKKIDLVKFGSYRPIKSMICKIMLLELLLAYAGIQHYEGFQVYRMMERQYYKAGEKRMEIDECMLIRIITRRGMVHLAWLAVVEKETSGFLHLIFYQL
ncbi:unnamed protein product [Amaranthus hypochondriacus]